MTGRPPLGPRALTGAERQARYAASRDAEKARWRTALEWIAKTSTDKRARDKAEAALRPVPRP